jgi:hypothetical protein
MIRTRGVDDMTCVAASAATAPTGLLRIAGDRGDARRGARPGVRRVRHADADAPRPVGRRRWRGPHQGRCSRAQCERLGELQHASAERDRAIEIGAFCAAPVAYPRAGITVADFTGLGVEDLFIAEACAAAG